MKALAIVLAVAFLIIGLLYGLGVLQLFTKSGTAHEHHITHLVACWVIAILCLIWYRFQSAPAR